MQAVVERHNRLAFDKDGLSPLEKMSGITGELEPTDFHTWGCPVYILDAANQGTICTPKWEHQTHWHLSSTLYMSCWHSSIGTQPANRPHQSPIPCRLRRRILHSAILNIR